MIISRTFSDVLDASRREEQRTALRSLLMQPVIFSGAVAGGNKSPHEGSRQSRYVEESFVLVRRHQAYLTNWLARYTGWTLIFRSGSARLVKRTADIADSTRGAHDPGGAGGPLSRSRYVLWCLALAVLHDAGRQTTLQRIAEQITRMAESIPELSRAGVEFDLKTISTRRSLVCVMRLLLAYGVIRRVEGDEMRFAESSTTDCLYNIDTGLLTDMLYTPRALADGPEQNNSLDERLSRFFPEQREEILRPRDLEHRLMGRLLDNPVIYYDDLSEREFQYWQSQRSRLLQVIEEAVGLVAELRAEGVALLDPLGDLTDAKMPDSGTVGHATLLVAEFLAQNDAAQNNAAQNNARQAATPVPMETLTAHFAELTEQHQTHWRKNVTEPAQAEFLLSEVLDRLEMLRMICRKPNSIQPLPAIYRFTFSGVDDSQ